MDQTLPNIPTVKPRTRLWRGFSTRNYYSNGGSFVLTDLELMKSNVLNFLHTYLGERTELGNPDYGTTIASIPFEVLDDETLEEIRRQVIKAFASEPRLTLLQLVIDPLPDANSIAVNVVVFFIDYNIKDEWSINLKLA